MSEHKIEGFVIPLCMNCIFWRDKGWDGDSGSGVCENPMVMKQVSLMSEQHIKPFVIGDTDQHKKAHARMIANSLRFDSHFSCVNHKPL